jgi:hypothetical protein
VNGGHGALGRMARALVLVVLIGAVFAFMLGIPIKTTHLAFVSDGRPLRVPGAVRVELTPSKDPPEAETIALLLASHVPVRVVLPVGYGGSESFRVRRGGVGPGGQEVLFPCEDIAACCLVLKALMYPCE